MKATNIMSTENEASDVTVPSEYAEDKTMRQETIGAVGAVGAMGTVGSSLPGNGAYVGGAALLGIDALFGRGNDSDGHLADSAEQALAEEPRLSANAATAIRIDAAFGVLELSGTVPTEADREIAEQTVSRLSGVNAVENKLHIADPK